jgi:hypothetical protein
MVEGLEAAEIILGYPRHSLSIVQGSWHLGTEQSAGTHDKSGVADLTAADVKDKMWVLRCLGFPGWWRRSWEGNWADHLHILTNGDPGMASLALTQNKAYLDGYNGLGSGYAAKDPFPRPAQPDVIFIQGAVKQRWVAIRDTQGKTSAGGAPKDGAYRTTGWTWPEANVATVKVGDTAWLVSPHGTFYRKDDFKAYVPPATGVPYYVAGPFAFGHQTQSARSPKVGSAKAWGTKILISKTQTVQGALWGYATIEGVGRWYLLRNFSKTPPTSKIEKIGELSVGAYNVAAQATGHSGTYPTRAPLSAQHMVDTGVDIWGVTEYGSGTTELNGKTYLTISDEARKAASGGNLVRTAHGAKWRYLLYREDTIDYEPNSGGSWTLPTHVDTDGTQITQAVYWKHDVKHLVCVVHFDVNSTITQLRAQMRETLDSVEVIRVRNGVRPWNVTIVGDTNCSTEDVRQVAAAWGFIDLADESPIHEHAEMRTFNYWKNEWLLGKRIDVILVPEGSAVSWETNQDGVASDHNAIHGVRAVYGTAA